MSKIQNHDSIVPIKITYITSLDKTQIEFTIIENKHNVTKYFEFDGKYIGNKDEYSVTQFLKWKLKGKAWICDFEVERIK